MIPQDGAPIIRIDFIDHQITRCSHTFCIVSQVKPLMSTFYWKIHPFNCTPKKRFTMRISKLVYPSHMEKLGRDQHVERYYKVEDIEEEPQVYRRNS